MYCLLPELEVKFIDHIIIFLEKISFLVLRNAVFFKQPFSWKWGCVLLHFCRRWQRDHSSNDNNNHAADWTRPQQRWRQQPRLWLNETPAAMKTITPLTERDHSNDDNNHASDWTRPQQWWQQQPCLWLNETTAAMTTTTMSLTERDHSSDDNNHASDWTRPQQWRQQPRL